MREIEFRGKREDNKEWLYGQLLEFKSSVDNNYITVIAGGAEWTTNNDWFNLCNTAKVDFKTIGQYTGLKDKNGKKIFEGDIVKIHKHSYDFGFAEDRIGQIKFIDGAFGFYVSRSENEYLFNELSTEFGYGELDYYEVIGNIYDNPDLLKEEI